MRYLRLADARGSLLSGPRKLTFNATLLRNFSCSGFSSSLQSFVAQHLWAVQASCLLLCIRTSDAGLSRLRMFEGTSGSFFRP